MYPGSTTLIIEIKATGVQLIPDTYIEWSMALENRTNNAEKLNVLLRKELGKVTAYNHS